MTLVDKIELKYRQAMTELEKVIALGPQTAQARYDQRKYTRNGVLPRRNIAGLLRTRHELCVEHMWVLKGIQETIDFLAEACLPEAYKAIAEEVGDVEGAIERHTETFKETTP